MHKISLQISCLLLAFCAQTCTHVALDSDRQSQRRGFVERLLRVNGMPPPRAYEFDTRRGRLILSSDPLPNWITVLAPENAPSNGWFFMPDAESPRFIYAEKGMETITEKPREIGDAALRTAPVYEIGATGQVMTVARLESTQRVAVAFNDSNYAVIYTDGESQPKLVSQHGLYDMTYGSRLEEVARALLTGSTFIMASDGAPYSVEPENEYGMYGFKSGAGGVVTGLLALLNYSDITWVTRAKGGAEVDYLKTGTLTQVVPNHYGGDPAYIVDPKYAYPNTLKLAFVVPTTEESEWYYEHISNPLLWFIQHNIPLRGVPERQKWDAGYRKVNQMYADAIAKLGEQQPDPDYVLIHDYQLYLVPKILREKKPGLKTLHFTHIPWPPAARWQAVANQSFARENPIREWIVEIIESLLHASALGFQTKMDVKNFIETASAFVPPGSLTVQGDVVQYDGREVLVKAMPISIDPQYMIGRYEEARNSPEQPFAGTSATPRAMLDYYRSLVNQMILRVERLDPSKGVYEAIDAYRELLKRKRDNGTLVDTTGKATLGLFAILIPSREEIPEYDEYKRQTLDRIRAVNSEFAPAEVTQEGFPVGASWRPIMYFNRNNWLLALYAMGLADAVMVTSRADGMNLVAKETAVLGNYAGHQHRGPFAALVLSTSVGAFEELGSFVTAIAPPVNPMFDPTAYGQWTVEAANALEATLNLSPEQRQSRSDALAQIISTHDQENWLFLQLHALQTAPN